MASALARIDFLSPVIRMGRRSGMTAGSPAAAICRMTLRGGLDESVPKPLLGIKSLNQPFGRF